MRHNMTRSLQGRGGSGLYELIDRNKCLYTAVLKEGKVIVSAIDKTDILIITLQISADIYRPC